MQTSNIRILTRVFQFWLLGGGNLPWQLRVQAGTHPGQDTHLSQGHSQPRSHSHPHPPGLAQSRSADSPHLHIFGIQEETGVQEKTRPDTAEARTLNQAVAWPGINFYFPINFADEKHWQKQCYSTTCCMKKLREGGSKGWRWVWLGWRGGVGRKCRQL